jgi:HD-GYP domain-containing protein (c-di-GMP phosphodiesterase class II)
MSDDLRVLYLVRKDEHSPPDALTEAAGSVLVLPFGEEPNESVMTFDAQVIALSAPFDRDARAALERVARLHVPVLGFGPEPEDFPLHSVVTVEIAAADLRTVLRLIAQREHAFGPTRHTDYVGAVLLDDVVRLLEHVMSLRMPGFRERAQRTLDACLWIGHHLHLPSAELKDLLIAARVREVGKLGLPDHLLTKRRADLTREERTMYERYPELGARVLTELPALRGPARIVEYQLEDFDGNGPRGLAAHQIPLGARVLRVAGAFAMLADVDNARGTAQLLARLEEGRGSQYDPLLVRLVENLHQSGENTAVHDPGTRWVRLTDLAEGMVLAEDIWSRSGVKIAPRGTRMTPHILNILRQFPVDSTLESVRVQK